LEFWTLVLFFIFARRKMKTSFKVHTIIFAERN